MQSFRHEVENPVVQKDIIDLEKKIFQFKEGKIDPEKFRTMRLARGIYGQRQQGVQMIRIKIPFGRITPKQLDKIAAVSEEYGNAHLHLTTRQDIQLHYVSLDCTPQLWAKLEQDEITLREACGNTVRNITGSAEAGIDPLEPFDISPYAYDMFSYFLRNPVCAELGRKIKIAFSSNENDSSFSYIHDLGFIPKTKIIDGKSMNGFKVVIAGGLGAQPILAQTAFEFLPASKIIPFTETVLRVFDRHGERTNRHKARLKYLVAKFGLQGFLNLVNEQENSVAFSKDNFISTYKETQIEKKSIRTETILPELFSKYKLWLSTNTFEQKQKGYFGVYIRVKLGNITADEARQISQIVREFAADDFRITNNQGFLLKHVLTANLPALFNELYKIGFAEPGFDSTVDITACPGTETCNLAISSSTGIAEVLETLVENEFPHLLSDRSIKIKISGCMNSCAQHGLATIGFHGSSLKAGNFVVPALQVLLGGGTIGNGEGRIADKVIKIPSKRGKIALRILLQDYESQKKSNENFIQYYDRSGKDYFYRLLKPVADTSNLDRDDFIDWGSEQKFETAIGVGECAGVTIDLVQTLFLEAREKNNLAFETITNYKYADALYLAYSSLIQTAKAYLLGHGIATNTQINILNEFEKFNHEKLKLHDLLDFKEFVLEINLQKPEPEFVWSYLQHSLRLINLIESIRKNEVLQNEKIKQPLTPLSL